MKKFEQPPKQERNIKQDKLAFIEAIESSTIQEIEAEFDEQSATSLNAELEKSKLFLLGETHGVKENPNIIYTLFKKFGFKQLALEWDKKLQAQAERFLATEELDFEIIKDSPDGRVTSGHFALLKKLKEEGLLETLVCFNEDSPSDEWDKRDKNMAKNIIANLSRGPTIAIAGNLHTEVVPNPSETL